MHQVTLPLAFAAFVGVTVPPLWTEPDELLVEPPLELPLLLLLLLPQSGRNPCGANENRPRTSEMLVSRSSPPL